MAACCFVRIHPFGSCSGSCGGWCVRAASSRFSVDVVAIFAVIEPCMRAKNVSYVTIRSRLPRRSRESDDDEVLPPFRSGLLARLQYTRNKPKRPMLQTSDPSTPLKCRLETDYLYVLRIVTAGMICAPAGPKLPKRQTDSNNRSCQHAGRYIRKRAPPNDPIRWTCGGIDRYAS